MAEQQAIERSTDGFFLIEFLVALTIFLFLVTTVTAYHWQVGRNHINACRRLALLKDMTEQIEVVAGGIDPRKERNRNYVIQQQSSLVDPAIFEGDALFKKAVKNCMLVSLKGQVDTIEGLPLRITITTVVINRQSI